MQPRYWQHKEYESPLNAYRVAAGLTHKELAEKAGVHRGITSYFASGTESPLYVNPRNRESAIKPAAQKIADALNVSFEDLFPRYFCKLNLEQGFLECQLQNLIMMRPIDGFEMIERRDLLEKLMSSLTPREKKAIKSIFWEGETLEEAGEKLGVTKARMGNIMNEAISKMTRKKEIFMAEEERNQKIKNLQLRIEQKNLEIQEIYAQRRWLIQQVAELQKEKSPSGELRLLQGW